MDLHGCKERLQELEKAREELLKLTREMKINATKAIASIHAGRREESKEYLSKAIDVLQKVRAFKKYPEIYYTLTHDAMQELVEALAFHSAVLGDFHFSVPVDVEPSAFVTGLADLVGELRRYTLSKLIDGDFEKAERLITLMEEIYGKLIDFTSLPDKLVPGLRHKLDVARAGIERTKSDYIAAKVARLNESLGGN